MYLYYLLLIQLIYGNFSLILKVDVKANSDVKHAKSQLSAENKKKKALEKSLADVCIYTSFHMA